TGREDPLEIVGAMDRLEHRAEAYGRGAEKDKAPPAGWGSPSIMGSVATSGSSPALTLAAFALVALAAPAAAGAETPPDDAPLVADEPPPPRWGLEGPYRLDVFLAGGIGARLDEPPRLDRKSTRLN